VVRLDGPEAVELVETDVPEPAKGEVLVEVKAASPNFPDLLLSQGLYQYKLEPPFIPGGEFAGVVQAAPAGATVQVGDRVAGIGMTGAFAEYVTAAPDRVLPLPDSVSFAAGSCLPMNYLTMIFALTTRGQLRAGETVLVHGAAGGIGTATIQLARALGAKVIAVVSTPAKAEFVTGLGADEVVLADGFKAAVDELTKGEGVQMVVDPVGGDRFTDSLRSLSPLGRLLVIGFTAGDIPTVKVNRLLLGNIDVRGVGWGAYVLARQGIAQADWQRLVPYLEAGKIDPPIDTVYPLEEAGKAIARLGERTVLGKVVVQP
jgi:NADPH2:quinone reductase